MLRTNKPLKLDHLLVSDSETESDDLSSYFSTQAQKRNVKGKGIKKKKIKSKCLKIKKKDSDGVIKHAQMYQEYMKKIEIPKAGDSVIPFNTWQELANSLKQMYGQPLHYLTRILLKKWDQSRINTENEHKPIDTIIHPNNAEATIWLIEETHRRTTSHHHLAKLWLADPMYHAFIDPIVSLS